jgi:hypothetical protein
VRFEQAREGGDVGGEVKLLGGDGARGGCSELEWGCCCFCCAGLAVRVVVDRAMCVVVDMAMCVVRGLGRKREVHIVVLIDGSRAGRRAAVRGGGAATL